MLEQEGASPYDVAKMPDDTIGSIKMHYATFVPELLEPVRGIPESASKYRNGAKIAVTNTLQNAAKVMYVIDVARASL